MRIYGYARISTMKQSIARQIDNIKAKYPDAVIIHEEYTGTTTDRPAWNKLRKNLKAGDTVIVARRLTGGLTEYRSESGMACLGAGAPGPVLLVLYAIFAQRRQAHS